jgi:FAD/FMN-containing dehydrogenase
VPSHLEFVNWGRNFSITPSLTCTPEHLDDIVEIVREAESANLRVHAFGSKWSFSDCAVTPDCLVDMTHLGRPIQTIQKALSSSAGDPSLLYHVEAGITLEELYLALDNFVDPLTGTKRRLAMETLPGSSGQTLAGAISTGTHGGR